MITQIYEVRNPEEAGQLVAVGVDHIGVLVGDGEFPRELNLETAKKVFKAVSPPTKRIALSLSRDLRKIEQIVNELQPDILHLGAVSEALTPDEVIKLKKPFPHLAIMRSIPVTGKESVALAKSYDRVADYLLLDSHKKEDAQVGATGLTHDWSISREIVESVKIPVILAGGLGADNVAEAIRQVRPYGVDSKTKTDKAVSHEKDIGKVKKFVEIAKSTSASAI
jgi:phosphoribosylanthranilate isomerase